MNLLYKLYRKSQQEAIWIQNAIIIKPLLSPKQWYDQTNCGYNDPADSDIEVVIKQNLEGERCAIDGYEKLLEMTQGKDHATYQLILEILNDELEHEEDLESFLEDMGHAEKK